MIKGGNNYGHLPSGEATDGKVSFLSLWSISLFTEFSSTKERFGDSLGYFYGLSERKTGSE